MTSPNLDRQQFDRPSEQVRPADWQRLLQGRALGLAEVDSSIAVSRRISTPSGEIALIAMLDYVSSMSGSIIALEAEAGEGKSTYLALLTRALADDAIVLRWNPGAGVDWQQPLDYAAFQRSIGSPPGASLVVLAELPPVMTEHSRAIVQTALYRQDVADENITVLLAGRPGVLRSCLGDLAAEAVRLLPLNEAEGIEMCKRLTEASQALHAMPPEEMARRYPHLQEFLSLPRADQLDTFLRPGQPLIVGLLQAVYGLGFVARLVTEYEGLSVADRRAYLHVCLASASGLTLPDRLLTRLAPSSDLDSRSREDPWTRSDSMEHTARHPVIAQTVIEAARVFASVSDCFSDWTLATREDPARLSDWHQVIVGIMNWRSVAGRSSRERQDLRRRLRSELTSDKGLENRLIHEGGRSASWLFSWAVSIRLLASGADTRQADSLFSLAESLLTRSLELADERAERGLAERAEYELDLVWRDWAACADDEETIDDLLDRLRRWRDLVHRGWVTAEFFSNVFDLAENVARRLTYSVDVEYDGDDLFLAFDTLGSVGARLQSLDSSLAAKRWPTGGELLNRVVYLALPRRHLDVLRNQWTTVRDLHLDQSLPGVALSLASALLDAAAEMPDCRDDYVNEATAVLNSLLFSGGLGEASAILLLSRLPTGSMRKRELHDRALEILGEGGFRGPRSSQARASLHLSLFFTSSDREDEKRDLLAEAVEAFAAANWGATEWDAHGENWREAILAAKRVGMDIDEHWRRFSLMQRKHQRIRLKS